MLALPVRKSLGAGGSASKAVPFSGFSFAEGSRIVPGEANEDGSTLTGAHQLGKVCLEANPIDRVHVIAAGAPHYLTRGAISTAWLLAFLACDSHCDAE
mmetsp:Transcript_26955/g.56796  ORF Transcript_26955/g.56796 Transcript_26955/m.56796 type:complete len:99 (+) Transcript_26955:1220-1516(+)